MANEAKNELPQTDIVDDTQPALVYESNPKHRDPWQTGKKGSICEAEVRPIANELLNGSVLWEGKRYAIFKGKAFCAQEHRPNHWHGYPVGWVEVPAKLVLQFLKEERITKRNRKQYWEVH